MASNFLICRKPYERSFLRRLRLLGLIGILLFFLVPTYAQNTKGDRTQSQRGAKREAKFKSSKKKGKPQQSYNRVQGRRLSPANRATESKKPRIYPQKGMFVNNKSATGKIAKKNQRSSSGRISPNSATGRTRNTYPRRTQPSSATGKTRNVYPQWNSNVNNPSRKPKSVEHAVSNRREVARVQKMSYKPDPPKRRRVTPKSASRSYVSRRSINAFAGFWNKKPKGEKAYVGDISGRKLRTKNYETPRPKVIKPSTAPYYGRKRVGDKPYKGPAGGGYVSATKSGKAWRGDVAGRKIRGRNFSSKRNIESAGGSIFPPKKSKRKVGDRPYKGSIPGAGYKTVTGKIKKGTGPIPVRAPGIGADKIGNYQGNIRGRKSFSPQGADYSGNIRGRKAFTPQGADYSGNMKARKPLKGGGSISGRRWNNQGMPISVRTPGIGADKIGNYQGNIRGRKSFTPQGADYSGNIKTKRPLKGGGSVSGKLWNNQGLPITVRTPSRDAARAGTYQGNIKGKKAFSPQGADYSGNIKAKKPLKGGGSVSGKLWNNNQTPIPTRIPPAGAEKAGTFTGGYRRFDLKPSMRTQGEEFTGTIKAKKPAKGGGSVSGKLWNNNETPITVKAPAAGFEKVGYSGKIKISRKEYIKNPNSAEEALKKNRPSKSTYLVDDLQVKIKQQDYKQRPHGAKGSMPGIGPGKGSIKASEFTRAMKQNWNYKHNPSSSDNALDQHEPSKAFARATDYQGNIKMKKFKFFDKKDLHPDAAFVKTNKNNTDDERGVLTNFKLWWAR
ncbi:MAG TPA: hypothetical protein VGK39_01020, partial [Cyclobacteriaceae bacterium]